MSPNRSPQLPPLEDLPPSLEELPPLEADSLADDDPQTPSRQRRGGVKRRHRAVRSSTSSSGADPRSRGLLKIKNFVEDACLQVALPPSPMPMFLPVTGQVFLVRGPQFADRVVVACEQDQRLYNAMLRAAKYGGYLGLASIASTISVAVLADLGGPGFRNGFMAQRVVGEEIRAVYGATPGEQEQNGAGPSNPAAAGIASGWVGGSSAG